MTQKVKKGRGLVTEYHFLKLQSKVAFKTNGLSLALDTDYAIMVNRVRLTEERFLSMMHRAPAGAAILIFTVVLLLTVAPVLPAGAQNSPVIQQAELRLWPEYDDPGLLVIFSGSFESKTAFPLQVVFPIPSGARNVQATFKDESGTLINRPFEIKDDQLTYELPAADFHFEFYLDRAPSGDERTIAYTLDSPYAVRSLSVAVQQPARATGFTLIPAAEDSQQGSDGLTYHILNRQNLAAGESIDLVLKYTKPDTGLTAPQLAVTTTDSPVQSGATQTTTTSGSAAWLPWLLIGLGVVLLAASLTYWILSQRRNASPSLSASGRTAGAGRSRPANTRPSAPHITAAAQQTATYCTHCGHQLRAEDRFCSQCGTPRRS